MKKTVLTTIIANNLIDIVDADSFGVQRFWSSEPENVPVLSKNPCKRVPS